MSRRGPAGRKGRRADAPGARRRGHSRGHCAHVPRGSSCRGAEGAPWCPTRVPWRSQHCGRRGDARERLGRAARVVGLQSDAAEVELPRLLRRSDASRLCSMLFFSSTPASCRGGRFLALSGSHVGVCLRASMNFAVWHEGFAELIQVHLTCAAEQEKTEVLVRFPTWRTSHRPVPAGAPN